MTNSSAARATSETDDGGWSNSALRRRAEEGLATDGTDRTRLGYDALVKLKMDEFLEREFVLTDVSEDRGKAEIAAT